LNPGIFDAARGCRLQQIRLETAANNLANVSTAGFKKEVLCFDQFLRSHQETNMEQGNMTHTGNPLDVGLSGDGFFKVNTPSGIRFTRDGRFLTNAEGVLVTSKGDSVMGESGTISVEGKEVVIDESGGVTAAGSQIDTLEIVSFGRPERLRKEGEGYYVYDGDEGEQTRPVGTTVKQGYVEESNVVVTEEVVRMIETLRNFESYQKVLQTFDETDTKLITEVGKL